MEVVNIETLKNLKEKLTIAIGFFDGVHLGHQAVILRAVQHARENQVKSLVITFDRSPKVVLGYAEDNGYLTPTVEKLRLFSEMGIDYALVLEFDKLFLNLSADAFIDEYLLKIGACYVSVGFDFKFGRGGAGNTELMGEHGFKLEVTEPVLMDGAKVSSTRIKACLRRGDLKRVNQMLGRPFSMGGVVVQGRQLGRTIGFSTANLKLDEGYLVSLHGVFATISYVDDGGGLMSMTNVGINPTVASRKKISIETHILDFNADIYGKQMRVEFLSKIRDEVQFNGIDELVAQLERDKDIVKSMSTEA